MPLRHSQPDPECGASRCTRVGTMSMLLEISRRGFGKGFGVPWSRGSNRNLRSKDSPTNLPTFCACSIVRSIASVRRRATIILWPRGGTSTLSTIASTATSTTVYIALVSRLRRRRTKKPLSRCSRRSIGWKYGRRTRAICWARLTEGDIRLFTTLIRFDSV